MRQQILIDFYFCDPEAGDVACHCEGTDETEEVCNPSMGLSVGPSFLRLMLCWASKKYGLCYCFSVFHFVFSMLMLKILLFLPSEVISFAPITYLIFSSLFLCVRTILPFNHSKILSLKFFSYQILLFFSVFFPYFFYFAYVYICSYVYEDAHACMCMLHEGQRSNSNAITTNWCTNIGY